MKKTILTVYLLFAVLFSAAQISYENKIEIKLKDGYHKEQVLGIGEQGFIIHSKRRKALDEKTIWKYELFNADMNPIMSKEISVGTEKNAVTGFYTDDHIYSFYTRRPYGDITLFVMRIPSMEIVLKEDIAVNIAALTSMGILGDYVFLGISNMYKSEITEDEDAVLVTINWKTGESKTITNVVEGYDNRQTFVFDIQPSFSSSGNEIMVYVDAIESRRKIKNYLIRYDSTGKKLGEINFSEINPYIMSASANQLDDNQLMFSGTYGAKSLAMPYAEGIFFGSIKNDNIEFSKTYQFTDLENFFTYLPSKKQEKIKRKKQKNANFNKYYIMNMHPTIPWGDGYLLIGEAILKHVSTRGGYNGTVPITNVSYEGTHAFVLKFDKEGNLLWDKAFKMPTYSHKYPPKYIRVTRDKDYIQLAFVLGGKRLTSKKINHAGKILQEYESPIIEKKDNQNITGPWHVTINYWYDNYFIVYGKHKIKNKKAGNQRVFFVSKIKYE